MIFKLSLHHIIRSGLFIIFEKFFITFIIPPFVIYGAIKIANQIIGIIPNKYKNQFVSPLSFVSYSFPLKKAFSFYGDI